MHIRTGRFQMLMTGALVLAALQVSPYSDIDRTPPRICIFNVREVPLLHAESSRRFENTGDASR